jgi:hypothetical protein
MSSIIKLPSGLKVNDKWKPDKTEFCKVLKDHFPFNKMQEDKQKKEIEKDWKVYSKALVKNKPSLDKE